MKLKWASWSYGLFKCVIGGAAATGSAYLGTLVGNQITAEIPVMNWRTMLFVIGTSSITNLFFYLSKSPLPEESTGNTEILTKPKE